MRREKKGFTLIEILIVLVIVSMLSIVLFRTYSTVSEIAFRLQQEKYIMQDSLAFSQILQNAADTAKIDYDRYGSELQISSGLVDHLYLRDNQGSFAVFTTGECVSSAFELTGEFTPLQRNTPCRLFIQRSGEQQIPLTDPGHVLVSHALFKIIPYENPQAVLSGQDSSLQVAFLRLHQPGFWLFMHVYSPRFGSEWIQHVSLSLQQFFTLKP
ncbi:MAG: type II secretion system protein [Candidatus Absconditabacteria bacterium]